MKKEKIRIKIESLTMDSVNKSRQVKKYLHSDILDCPKIIDLCKEIDILNNQVKILNDCLND